jgi:hypothetical protein
VLPAVAAAQAGGNASVLCIAPDGVLHASGIAGTCAPGQTAVPLATPGNPRQGTDDCDTPTPPGGDDLTALTGTAHRVVAPFEVVDKSGNHVLAVGEDRTMRLYNAAGNDVVRLAANPDGGHLLTRNGTGLAAAIGTSGTEASFNVIEGTIKRAELGRNKDSGNYRVVFFPPGGAFHVAGFGESENHEGGTAFITDKSGTRGAGMWMTEHGGQFGIGNGAKKTVATLTKGKTAGGLLEIQAGPASFMQAAGLGLPGSHIAGKAK